MGKSTLHIAPGVTAQGFKSLNLKETEGDWAKGAQIFLSRFESRYFNPLSAIDGQEQSSESVNGFIILSCCFLLAETLGGFKRGVGDHTGQSKTLFSEGLEAIEITTGKSEIKASAADIEKIYTSGRCALLHGAGTDMICIRRSGPLLEKVDARYNLNRSEFLKWLRRQYSEYASVIENPAKPEGDGGKHALLRTNFIKKMNYICDTA